MFGQETANFLTLTIFWHLFTVKWKTFKIYCYFNVDSSTGLPVKSYGFTENPLVSYFYSFTVNKFQKIVSVYTIHITFVSME